MLFQGILSAMLFLAQTASWQGNGIFFHELEGRQVEVPPSDLAQTAFAETVANKGTNDSGLLVCRASVGNLSTDFIGPLIGARFARTDLGLILTVKQGGGWQEVIVASGPDNKGEAYFFLPGVKLDKPYQITVEAFDRDIYRHDKLETFTFRAPAGNEWHHQATKTALECRSMPGWLFGQYIAQQKGQFSINLRQLQEVVSYSLEESVIINLEKYLMPARDNIRQLAGLLGWSSPVVTQHIANLEPEEKRLQQLITAAFDQRLLAARPEVTIGNLKIAYEGTIAYKNIPPALHEQIPFYSEMTATTLLVKIRVENHGPEPVSVSDGAIGPLFQPLIIGADGTNDLPRIAFQQLAGKWQRLDFDYELSPGKSGHYLIIPGMMNNLLDSRTMPELLRLPDEKSTNGYSYLLLK